MATTADMARLDSRDAAALTEPLTTCLCDPAAGPHEVAVYSSYWDGEQMVTNRYLVNPDAGFCSCDDWHFRQPEGGCKHILRVQYETGQKAVPSWANRAAIDRDILQNR